MAFTLYASVGGETTQLNDSNPFRLESAEELTGAEVVRHQQRGPLQQGATDLGFRLQPRVLTLNILFSAATDAILDTHRDTLMDTFKPLTDISIFLYAVRDDGTILRLTCKTVDDIDIELAREDRPGHLHRARVKLRAANPLWVDQTISQYSFSGLDATTSWWLGGGIIPSWSVLDHGESPAQGASWAWAGTTVAADIHLTIAIRSQDDTLSGTKYAYYVDNVAAWPDVWFGISGTVYAIGLNGTAHSLGTAAMTAGTSNYFIQYNHDGQFTNVYRGTVTVASDIAGYRQHVESGTNRRWRSNATGLANFWVRQIPKYAIYSTTMTDTMRAVLDSYMAGTALGFNNVYFNAANEGDVPTYPVIKLYGPMSAVTVTNDSTGASFSLGTTVIGSADVYTIDLRGGDKLIYDANGVNKMADVSSPVALAQFYLAPAPIVAGGTNVIHIAGTATADASRATIEHYNYYLGL